MQIMVRRVACGLHHRSVSGLCIIAVLPICGLVMTGLANADQSEAAEPTSVGIVHESSALENMQLFFRPEERLSGTGSGERNEGQSSITIEPGNTSEQTISSPIDTGSRKAGARRTENHRTIHYDARLQSRGWIRIVLNGRPCQPVARLVQPDVRTESRIECPSLTPSTLSIFLLSDEMSVKVVNKTVVQGILLPGRTL